MSGIFKKLFGPADGGISAEKIKAIVEEVMAKINLKRKVDSITYRPNHDWYIIRFYSPPSCIIPRKHFQDYIKSQGSEGKQEIIQILSSAPKGANLV